MHLQKKADVDDAMDVDEKPKRGRGAAKKDAPAKAKAAPKKAPKKKKEKIGIESVWMLTNRRNVAALMTRSHWPPDPI